MKINTETVARIFPKKNYWHWCFSCLLVCHAFPPLTFAQATTENAQNANATLPGKGGKTATPPEIPGLHYSSKWPTNFPLPAYSSNVVSTNFTNSTKGSSSAAAFITTKDPPDGVFKWYQACCQRDGWTIGNAPAAIQQPTSAGRLLMLNASKGRQRISICCVKNVKTNITSVSINWAVDKSSATNQ